ncbi:MAG TPA: hypothetical protein VG034_11300 [Acidimicrobiia bacterium]|nr:hypothetical protein [Acidimicrobiia bacterium]
MNLDRLADVRGTRIIQASLGGTAVFALTGLPAAAGVEAFQVPSAVISLVLFVVSIPLALLALARAAVRTARQEDRITVTSLFFLQASAPKPVRRLLLGSLAVSLVVTVLSAAREPFGILEPVFPLALCGQWAARHGTFPRIPNPSGGGPPD